MQFSAYAGFGFLKNFKNCRSQNIAADDGEIRRCVFQFWFLDHVVDFVKPRISRHRLCVEDAVGGNRFAFDNLCGDDRTLLFLEDLDHLFEAGNFAINDVVGEKNGEWFIANQFTRGEYGVAQAKRFFLAYVGRCRSCQK